jgi:hypothetical protein
MQAGDRIAEARPQRRRSIAQQRREQFRITMQQQPRARALEPAGGAGRDLEQRIRRQVRAPQADQPGRAQPPIAAASSASRNSPSPPVAAGGVTIITGGRRKAFTITASAGSNPTSSNSPGPCHATACPSRPCGSPRQRITRQASSSTLSSGYLCT